MIRHRVFLSAVILAVISGSAMAQVTYDPYGRADHHYRGPGVLQPDETRGTAPSYVIAPNGGYGGGPLIGVVARCQYPDGWNVTDFSRDVNGIPAGIDHSCR